MLLLGWRGAISCLNIHFHLKTTSRCLSVQRYRFDYGEKQSYTYKRLLKSEKLINFACRSNSQHRVVLLPEVPPDTPQTNPLLRMSGSQLPELANLTEQNCYNGLGKALLEYESAVVRMEEQIR